MKKRCSGKFRKCHKKKPVLESVFNKKETPTQIFSCEICEISKNTHFEENLLTAASDGTVQ